MSLSSSFFSVKLTAMNTKRAYKERFYPTPDGQLYIAKSKTPLNIRWSRPLWSEPSSITISKDRAGRYFVSMLCEFEVKPMPIGKKTVGIEILALTKFCPVLR